MKILSRLTIFGMVMFCPAMASAQSYSNLLADRSLAQWMQTDGSDVGDGWQFEEDGTLRLNGRGNNIVTRDEYGDFDLWFDYRISPKGNNGIKYRVRQYGDSWLGLEYQIQDDAAFPDMGGKHLTASLYDIFEKSSPILERQYSPLPEFAVGRIIVQRNRIRHWLNGQLIIDELDCTDRFSDAVADSKFRDHQGFGRNHCGRLMLTDHGSEVWFRNLYVRRLDGRSLVP